jgi:hypothetical protein
LQALGLKGCAAFSFDIGDMIVIIVS